MRSTRISFSFILRRLGAVAFVAAASALVAGCEDSNETGLGMVGSARAQHPVSPQTVALMQKKGISQNAPVLIRTYKKEAEFEVWKMKADGRYTLLKTYPMCRWSGQLGPKVREGDRQVPEGFYKITPGQMNPNSNYYLSFNVGYPNAYDRAWGHEGGSIMVHGACSSAGCFSMTDHQIDEIYALARDGFAGGQQAIQMQSFPFHMNAENMAKYRADQNIAFWKQLKEGADHFEVTQQDVRVGVCSRHYVFDAVPANGGHFEASEACPSMKRDDGIEADVAARAKGDDAKVAELVAAGQAAIHTVYADGGQNSEFAKANLDDVSRPDAIAAGPTDWLIEPKGRKMSPVVKVAAAKAAAPATTAAKAPETPEKTALAAEGATVPGVAGVKVAAIKKTDTKKLGLTDRATTGSLKPQAMENPSPLVQPQAMASPAPQVMAGAETLPRPAFDASHLFDSPLESIKATGETLARRLY